MASVSLLTEFHANVLIWILLPEFLILIFVTHERENDFLTDGLGQTTPLAVRHVRYTVTCTIYTIQTYAGS